MPSGDCKMLIGVDIPSFFILIIIIAGELFVIATFMAIIMAMAMEMGVLGNDRYNMYGNGNGNGIGNSDWQ